MCRARDNAKRTQEGFSRFWEKKNLYVLSFGKFLASLQYHSQYLRMMNIRRKSLGSPFKNF
ncbi:hypothetical protein CER18_00855 [Bartonella tribocorum]|uniref:Uncharacterized protein n=1 Tax=Bartonella tribocorum TaxID=85701 RepID=A0A2M6UVR8_9HYPH|nr:hypothetical protein CER18_00855 [Bartonella tribocorum]